jgi:hypothetical protein
VILDLSPRLLLNQALLFAHVMAFAVTVAAVLREDLRWLLQRRIDPARLRGTMRTVCAGLVVLWVTGLALWAFAAAASPVPWGLTPKLAAKLVVVSLLTLNGWALHAWVFPGLQAGGAAPSWPALMLGAFSSASWLFAAFVGVARPMMGVLPFSGFMALYAASLGLALLAAMLPLPAPVAQSFKTRHR